MLSRSPPIRQGSFSIWWSIFNVRVKPKPRGRKSAIDGPEEWSLIGGLLLVSDSGYSVENSADIVRSQRDDGIPGIGVGWQSRFYRAALLALFLIPYPFPSFPYPKAPRFKVLPSNVYSESLDYERASMRYCYFWPAFGCNWKYRTNNLITV